VAPGPDGRVRDELSEGVAPVSEGERESWRRLRPGAEALAAVGARPVVAEAGEELYERTGAAPAVDVNMVATGEPRTIVPSQARAYVSLRLAPGQRAATMGAELERLLRSAAPAGAEVAIEMELADPALFDPRDPALELAAIAMERACDTPPVFLRLGGTLPLLAVLAERGVTAIVSGFALDADAIHAPDESYRLESLRLGELAARELYGELGRLSR
jgi:acetylornithine deacetylase/succinyl-diaminopimelate desuccinylase-like protein